MYNFYSSSFFRIIYFIFFLSFLRSLLMCLEFSGPQVGLFRLLRLLYTSYYGRRERFSVLVSMSIDSVSRTDFITRLGHHARLSATKRRHYWPDCCYDLCGLKWFLNYEQGHIWNSSRWEAMILVWKKKNCLLLFYF